MGVAAFMTVLWPLWLWISGQKLAAVVAIVGSLWTLIAVSHNVEIEL